MYLSTRHDLLQHRTKPGAALAPTAHQRPVSCLEETFTTHDGLSLYARLWRTQEASRGSILVLHGAAEHCGRYHHFAEALVARGYQVYAYDLRGHGRSEGPRLYVGQFQDHLGDLDAALSRLRARAAGLPLFVFGHSMGGTIATRYALERKLEVHGLMLSAAALKLSDGVSPLLVRLSQLLGRSFPRLPLVKMDSRFMSRDPAVVAAYDTDPLVFRRGTPARTAVEFLEALQTIDARMETLALPLLILHGTDDHLVAVDGSRQLYNRACAADKTLRLYDGGYHELINDLERERVIADILEWLDART